MKNVKKFKLKRIPFFRCMCHRSCLEAGSYDHFSIVTFNSSLYKYLILYSTRKSGQLNGIWWYIIGSGDAGFIVHSTLECGLNVLYIPFCKGYDGDWNLKKKNMHGKIETEYFNTLYNNTVTKSITQVVVAEWLRRWTRNPLGSPRAGSNPADYEILSFWILVRERGHFRGNLSSQNCILH